MTSDHEAADLPDEPIEGAAAEDAAASAPAAEPSVAEAPAGSSAEQQLAERTLDLQRLQAEYLNYKRRVDRDRAVIRNAAVASVVTSLLPMLDDIGRADQHGELQGGFKAVADSLQQAVGAHGLEVFGEDGDVFDPNVHEALMHGYSAEVDRPTADKILQVGYRIGERVLRPARVSVVEPGGGDDGSTVSAEATEETES